MVLDLEHEMAVVHGPGEDACPPGKLLALGDGLVFGNG